MITVDEGSFFAIIVTAAVAAVTVVALPRRLAPPVVVIELLLGIVIGPHVLGIADSDEFIDFFSNLGLGMLFFFAGYEIDFERIKGKPLTLGAWGWLLSLVLAYGLGGALAAAGIVVSFLYTGSAMATTAIGTLIPILRDSGELHTRFGNYLLGAGAIGEFGPILLITLFLSTTQPLHEAVILVAFIVIALLLALTSVRLAWRGLPVLERTLEASSQLAVRIATVLVFGLVLLASKLGLDLLLGGFVAGMIVRAALRGHELEAFESKLTAVGFGFLIPFFFVGSGINFDLDGARERGGDRQALPLPRPLSRRPRCARPGAVPPRALGSRAAGAGVLLRHRAAARGRDHDPGDRRRRDAPVDRCRTGRRGDALDAHLSVRGHGAAPWRAGDGPGGRGHRRRLRRGGLVVARRAAAVALGLRAAALGGEPALAGGGRGPGRAAALAGLQRGGDPLLQALDGQARLRDWLRASWATAVTRGPNRERSRAFWDSLRLAEASTSNTASTREAVTLACWPPGPEEREVRSSISAAGISTGSGRPCTGPRPARPGRPPGRRSAR